jgi:transcriptional regulator with XRE-family HTH domain
MQNKLGRQLKKYRVRKFPGMGLRKAAEKIGISFAYLNKLERGLPPSDERLFELADIYELDTAERFELMKLAEIAHKDPLVVDYFNKNPEKLKAIFCRKENDKKGISK